MNDDTTTACIGSDPTCPCQDGDACHYKDAADGTKAMPVIRTPAKPPIVGANVMIHWSRAAGGYPLLGGGVTADPFVAQEHADWISSHSVPVSKSAYGKTDADLALERRFGARSKA